jgi:hypothetical protein
MPLNINALTGTSMSGDGGLPDRFSDLIRTRGRSLKHLGASPCRERTVVIESDDWGSRRMPSAKAREWLVSQGIIKGDEPYDHESLENAEDIARLSEVLSAFTDFTGRHPVLTCFYNPANPDFKAIREADFDHYFSESVPDTLDRRGDRREVEKAWHEARDAGLLVPEYHGREHLQVPMWMKSLRQPGPVRDAFDHEFYSVPLPDQPAFCRAFRAAYYFSEPSEIPELESILLDGARMFERQHGFVPRVFCPPNNVFHPTMLSSVRKAGCLTIVRPLRSKQPDGRGGGKTVLAWSRKPLPGMSISRRNAIFEPVMNASVDHAMKGIESAFSWGRPAVLSTHRVNYIGGINPAMRDQGIRALRELLARSVKTWPDVRFLASHELIEWIVEN